MAKAPVLNPEVRQAIPATPAKRDQYYTYTQGIIGAAVAAQANLATELLKQTDQWDSKKIFELASDAGRITALLQHHISKTRRALISPLLTSSARNVLERSSMDKSLFGENFLNKMKEVVSSDRVLKIVSKTNSSGTKSSNQESKNTNQSKSFQGNARSLVRKPHQTHYQQPHQPAYHQGYQQNYQPTLQTRQTRSNSSRRSRSQTRSQRR